MLSGTLYVDSGTVREKQPWQGTRELPYELLYGTFPSDNWLQFLVVHKKVCTFASDWRKSLTPDSLTPGPDSVAATSVAALPKCSASNGHLPQR